MKQIICHILAIAVLFLSTEGLWDMTNESHPHGDVYAHQLDDHEHHTIGESDPLTEDCADHCSNVCHGHMASVVANNPVPAVADASSINRRVSSVIVNRSLAPPTPPPNA